MNRLLEYLQSEFALEILKFRSKKFSIKTNVFVNSAMCTLKARAYQRPQGEIALEFQRRSGDTVAFSGIYRKASNYLQDICRQEGFQIVSGIPETPTFERPPS